jgi:hypothetical protein
MKTVTAVGHVKAMRGGAQSHLLKCSDGHQYVVKVANNPQGRRILINEWIAWHIFNYLGVAQPEIAAVEITPEFIQNNPAFRMKLGSHSLEPAAGLAFGSRYTEGFDFLPDGMLHRLSNREHFAGALVADTVLAQADARQCVFTIADGTVTARMIDNGYILNGPHWEFECPGLSGLYFRGQLVYRSADFEPWVARMEAMPGRVMVRARKSVPAQWLEPGEAEQLARRGREVVARRRKIRSIMSARLNELAQRNLVAAA